MKNIKHIKIILLVFFIILLFFGIKLYGVGLSVFIIIIYSLLIYIIFLDKSLEITAHFIQNFSGNLKIVEKLYKLAINRKGATPNTLISYGLILLKKGDAENSLILFERAETGGNILSQKSSLINQSLCYWKKGNIDKAIEILLYCIEKFEYINSDTYATLGYLYILKKDYDNAIKYTNIALQDNQDNASALDNMGQIYYNMLDFNKAKTYFLKAIDVKSSLVDSLYYLGIIEEKENNIDIAKLYFQKAYNCGITAFSTITRKQVDEKYFEYVDK